MMKIIFKTSLFMLAVVLLCQCEKGEKGETETTLAIVKTGDITVLNPNMAFGTGELIETGGAGVWEQGIAWSIYKDATLLENSNLSKPFRPNIEVYLTGLRPNTRYYAKAYAVNSKGKAYGDSKEFKTPDLINGTFTDKRDGRMYKWVKLGTQTWMAENLAYLPYVCSPDSQGGIWVYDYHGFDVSEAKLTEEYETYGCLYDWETACDICPDGWHLPSDDEWKELELYLGMSQEQVDGRGGYTRGGNTGNFLKETGTERWTYCDHEGCEYGTNVTGFAALPAGVRSYYFYGIFDVLGGAAAFYTSTKVSDDKAESRGLLGYKGGIKRSALHKDGGYSIRCVQDNKEALEIEK